MSRPMFAVIMAGGSGTRLWPQSRKRSPKHLLSLVGGKTMLEMTFDRIADVIDPSNVLVVTLAEQAAAVRECIPAIRPENVIAEPVCRSTAPCIGLAALVARERCANASMVVMPADHIVSDNRRFQDVVKLAAHMLDDRPESLITIGITPRRPATGFGYIKKGQAIAERGQDGFTCFRAQGFVEKPPLSRAREMIANGGYLWNAGVFFWRADTILRRIEHYLPELGAALAALSSELGSERFDGLLTELYERITPISIDYGIMQKAEQVLVIESDVGWDDVGSWASLANIWPADETGCASNCQLITVEARNCTAFSARRLVAIVGLEDVVVVDSDDAVLVCKKDRAEDVREVVQELESRGLKHLL
ncbi:MAG: mannose-1-phosphate guanylyltransferase [Candidatus Coatesbacteria bacterium]|nr:mannose-1-phosphate guanylyltransferase [Candidatus Coatesbacteria bacterium]